MFNLTRPIMSLPMTSQMNVNQVNIFPIGDSEPRSTSPTWLPCLQKRWVVMPCTAQAVFPYLLIHESKFPNAGSTKRAGTSLYQLQSYTPRTIMFVKR